MNKYTFFLKNIRNLRVFLSKIAVKTEKRNHNILIFAIDKTTISSYNINARKKNLVFGS